MDDRAHSVSCVYGIPYQDDKNLLHDGYRIYSLDSKKYEHSNVFEDWGSGTN